MKQLTFLLLAMLVFTSYDPVVDNDVYYDEYRPVVVSRSVLESAVQAEAERPFENPGRIYIKGDYLFIVEKFKGVHVVNNEDPSNPVNSGFIRIPGCLNMAVKGNIMYADNSVDIIGVDISNPALISVVSRQRNVLPEPASPNNTYIPWQYQKQNRPNDTYIVDYVKIDEE